MIVTEDTSQIIEVQKAIAQTNALAKWICGIIAALFLIGIGWMYTMSGIIREMERTLDKTTLISESQAKDILHLRGHADQAVQEEGGLKQSLTDIDHRLSNIEGQAAQGARFTAHDGEILAERIKINGERIKALEEWRQRTESKQNGARK